MDPVEKLNGLTSGSGSVYLGLIFIIVAFIVSLLKEEKEEVKAARVLQNEN